MQRQTVSFLPIDSLYTDARRSVALGLVRAHRLPNSKFKQHFHVSEENEFSQMEKNHLSR